MPHTDDAIFTAWIRGWATTREVAPPVAHLDGFRIESLGWRVHAPWATAVIPGPDDRAA